MSPVSSPRIRTEMAADGRGRPPGIVNDGDLSVSASDRVQVSALLIKTGQPVTAELPADSAAGLRLLPALRREIPELHRWRCLLVLAPFEVRVEKIQQQGLRSAPPLQMAGRTDVQLGCPADIDTSFP